MYRAAMQSAIYSIIESFNKRVSTGTLGTDQNNAVYVFYINARITNMPTSLCASRNAEDIIIINPFTV